MSQKIIFVALPNKGIMLTADVWHFYTSSKKTKVQRKNKWTEWAKERTNFTTGMLCVILDNLHAENKNSNQLLDFIWWRTDNFLTSISLHCGKLNKLHYRQTSTFRSSLSRDSDGFVIVTTIWERWHLKRDGNNS